MDQYRRKNININNGQTRCKKHPKHQQSPGVCSICLGERLSQISSTSNSSSSSRRAVNPYCSSSSSSSSLSSLSSCSSSELSPVHHRQVKWSKNNVFGKSRSMAFVGEIVGKNKKSGFWSKLLRPRSQKKNGHGDGGFEGNFVHSRTMRERMFATRVY